MNLLRIFKNSAGKKVKPKLQKVKSKYSKKTLQNKMTKKADSFFSKSLDLKPRSKDDYYNVGRWMVSKRLAAFGVMLALLIIVFYFAVISPISIFGESENGVRIYSYKSIPLRLVSGNVKIKDESGDIAYEGRVEQGRANGQGKLYYQGGKSVLYDGNFEDSKYSGRGTLYYDNGMVCYQGEFADNEFNGTGIYYRQSGSRMYEGDFKNGLADGTVNYYSSSDNLIYTGAYSKGMLLYSSLLGNSATDVTASYKGTTNVYYNEDIFLVELKDINVIYGDDSEQGIMEDSATAANIYVLHNNCYIAGRVCSSIPEVRELIGEPVYEGNVDAEVQEALALASDSDVYGSTDAYIYLDVEKVVDGVYELREFYVDRAFYIYTFQYEGVQYTFYCDDNSGDFFMYQLQSCD